MAIAVIDTDLEIATLALLYCGVTKAIAAIDADASAEDRAVNLFYYQTRDEVLELYPYTHAVEHRPLVLTVGYYEYNQEYTYTAPTISGITQADPAVVTATAHGFADGDYIKIYDVSGMTEVNRTDPYHISNKAANTFELTGINSTNWTAYTSGGSAVKLEPLAKYQDGFVYDLPSNYLYGIGLEGDYDFELKGIDGSLKLLCTVEDAVLKYIKNDVTTVSTWRKTFINLFALRLAIKLVPAIVGVDQDAKLFKRELMREYRVAENEAMYLQAVDKKVTRDTTDPWVTARGGV